MSDFWRIMEVLKNYGVSVDFAISNLNPSFVRLSSEAAICKTKEIAEIMNKKIWRVNT